jgi:hypothetical protein
MQGLAGKPLVLAHAVGPTPLEVLCELAGINIWESDLGEFNLISRIAA